MQPNVSKSCLEGEFCIKCNGLSGRVLVCSENGCPVGIHEACMNCEPKFDGLGKFYCPYCWYKRELEMVKVLRRKAMLAKKQLLNFTRARRAGENDDDDDDEAVITKGAGVSTMEEGNLNSGGCENGVNVIDDVDKEATHHSQGDENSKETSDEKSISGAHGFDNGENGERIQEDSIESSEDSEDDEIDEEDQGGIQPLDSSRLGIVEGTLDVPTKEIADAVGVGAVLVENQRKRGKEEEAVLPPKVDATKIFEFVSPDTETHVARPKRIKRTAQRVLSMSFYSEKEPSFQPSTSAKNAKINQESTKQLIIPILGPEKRRRLYWTAEEIDMLKEGVQKFSTEANKKIPWRKILEYGNQVFHSTRVPVDLKDKWKKMMAKESPQK